MLTGAVVMSIIMGAVATSFIAVQGSFHAESQIKSSVEGARTAVSFLERNLRLAGYGVDPQFVFDVGTTTTVTSKSNMSLTISGTDTAVTDDLAFRYRDPAWMRRGKLESNKISLESGTTFGAAFKQGQAFIVSCRASPLYTVVKADAAIADTASDVNVTAYGAPFTTSSASCLTLTGDRAPFVMMLHELRVRIRMIGGRPYLVAYRNLNDPSAANDDYFPLAADVESFQVAYVMNRPATGGTPMDSASAPMNWVLGDTGSAAADALPVITSGARPTYDSGYQDAVRYNKDPANVRSVRITIATRSSRKETKGRKAFQRVDLEDSAEGVTTADGYYRTNVTTTVRVPNLASRTSFNPPVSSAEPTDPNVGGG